MRVRASRHLRVWGVVSAAALAGAVCAGPARGQLLLDELEETKGVGVVDRRGEMLPLDVALTDASGRARTLGEWFDGERPVLVVPGYYDCPLLCTLVHERVLAGVESMSWTVGQEFRILAFSFDHTDTTGQARAKQDRMLSLYDRRVEDRDDAWGFATADATNARRLCKALGYHYRYLPESGEFSHNAAIFFVSPEGRITGFVEGLEYPGRTLTLALSEAADGEVGSLFERVVFSCFAYDPKTGEYVIHPMSVMRIGASAGALVLGGVIVAMMGRAAVRRRRGGAGAARVGRRGAVAA